MIMKSTFAITCASSIFFHSFAAATPSPWKNAVVVTEKDLSKSYDYIVAGGGTSGLVVANRLSEDGKSSVLVVEAGSLENAEDYVVIPALAGGAIGTKYDWNLAYVSNPDLGSREVAIPQGKVVGGSSLLNRMIFDRGSKGDYDRWEKLGSKAWGWDGLLPYFRKGENFTPPTAAQLAQWNITYDANAHGTGGHVQSTYSNYIWPALKYFILGLRELGIKTAQDGANGDAIGGYYTTHAQTFTTQERSSARKAYWDSASKRNNLHLLTNTSVTRITTSTKNGTVKATGVEIAASKDSKRRTMSVRKEVVLTAGALHSPQLLQLSGIGDSSLLSSFNISTVVDLPGVGRNLQDHPLLATVFSIKYNPVFGDLSSNTTFANEARAEYNRSRTGPYTGATGDYLAFLPAQNFSSDVSALSQKAASQMSGDFLDSDTPDTVALGYSSQFDLLKEGLTSTDLAVLEFIWGDGAVVLALQHPFSRGSVKIASADAFTSPILDAAFLRNPIDVDILVDGIKFVRKLTQTSAFAGISPSELVPGANVTSDADLQNFVRQNVGTTYHPVGSCSLGPSAQGGVVDDSLRVHGIQGLRVADASVIPLLPATHTQSTVYAIAEKAADIIIKGY